MNRMEMHKDLLQSLISAANDFAEFNLAVPEPVEGPKLQEHYLKLHNWQEALENYNEYFETIRNGTADFRI